MSALLLLRKSHWLFWNPNANCLDLTLNWNWILLVWVLWPQPQLCRNKIWQSCCAWKTKPRLWDSCRFRIAKLRKHLGCWLDHLAHKHPKKMAYFWWDHLKLSYWIGNISLIQRLDFDPNLWLLQKLQVGEGHIIGSVTPLPVTDKWNPGSHLRAVSQLLTCWFWLSRWVIFCNSDLVALFSFPHLSSGT